MAQLKDLIVNGVSRIIGNLHVSGKIYTNGEEVATNSNMSAATSSAAGKAGLVPAPAAGAQGKFLRGDGTWQTPTNTTYSNFVKSGSGAAAGLVPAPSTTAGTTKYLREDGTWSVPPDNNTTYTLGGLMGSTAKGSATQPVYWSGSAWTNTTYTLGKSVPSDAKFTDTNTWTAFKGATSSAAGTAGYVPAPAAGNEGKYFRGDGTWQTPTNTTYSNMSAATSSAAGKAGLVPAPAAGAQGKFLRGDGTWQTPTNTKNTAGSTDTSSKIFLIGATSQADNPQTYSHDTAYVGTDGCLYSNSTKVSVEGHTHSYVPTTRTVNGKALSSNISLTASDVGAAASSHGNHVPTTQTANNAVFLRNDNTWQTVTPANIGAAASGHTHSGYVPTTRTVNGKALSSNISLTASDVGAAASSHGTHVDGVTTASSVSHTNYNTNGTYVPTMNFLSFWNGAFSSAGASNLSYCSKGAFGTIVTKAATDYAYATYSSGNFWIKGGTLYIGGSTQSAAANIYKDDTTLILESSGGSDIEIATNNVSVDASGAFKPTFNNYTTLGSSSYLWKQLYAKTTTISTSDRNAKTKITDLGEDNRYSDLFLKLLPVSFVFKENESGRTHIGFISQDVEDAMNEVGLTSLEFAGFVKDKKMKQNPETGEEEPELDENGNEIPIYFLRYEEFIALNTMMIQKTIKRQDELENRIANIEKNLSK